MRKSHGLHKACTGSNSGTGGFGGGGPETLPIDSRTGVRAGDPGLATTGRDGLCGRAIDHAARLGDEERCGVSRCIPQSHRHEQRNKNTRCGGIRANEREKIEHLKSRDFRSGRYT